MEGEVFTNILNTAIRKGIIPNKSNEARTWFRNTSKKFLSLSPDQLMNENKTTLTNLMHPGRMYMFFYNAKTKQKLPYWDMFPLIFPIERYHDGFLGINLHYLHPQYRAKLMDALYLLASNDKFDDSTKLNISYDILKNMSKARFFRPCVKKYLNTQFRSRFLYVTPDSWDIALFLPLERFQKATKEEVWRDSRRIINV